MFAVIVQKSVCLFSAADLTSSFNASSSPSRSNSQRCFLVSSRNLFSPFYRRIGKEYFRVIQEFFLGEKRLPKSNQEIGWLIYWQRHPREICPKCGKKTYITPSEAEGWHDNEWQYIKIEDRYTKVLQKRCYLCGYREPLDVLKKRKEEELERWRRVRKETTIKYANK
jgi:hypothetical protein